MHGLVKRFSATLALDEVALDARVGEVLAPLGERLALFADKRAGFAWVNWLSLRQENALEPAGEPASSKPQSLSER